MAFRSFKYIVTIGPQTVFLVHIHGKHEKQALDKFVTVLRFSPFLSLSCSFNQLDLPLYETFDKLKQMLLIAVRECPEGFGFA